MNGASERRRHRNLEWLGFAALALVSFLTAIWLAGNYGTRQAAEGLRAQANGSVALNTAVLRSELDKQRTLAFVLSRDPDVIATLGTPDATRLAAMNAKLETLNAGTRSAVIYLINRSGTAIASSNWREPTSFVGTNYLFRPYFTVAVAEGEAAHYALGTVSQRPGLYIARRVEGASGFLGVIVLKIEFFNVEADWRQSGAVVYVTDPRGIVLLTSMPEWRFLAEGPILPADKEKIRASLQFGDAPLTPLPLHSSANAIPGTDFVTMPARGLQLASAGEVPTTDWRLHLLEPAGDALAAGANTSRAIAFGLVGAGLVLLGILLLRRQRAIERTIALTENQAELERRVAERTRDLSHSNARLSAEIDERHRLEAKLQVARDELTQANRLAILGQVTAGLAHEVNQPVAAIRVFADNAVTFLDRHEPAPARSNMATIAGLTDRIADIIAQLRRFSRKATGELEPVSLREALDGALLLVSIRARRQNTVLNVPEVSAGLRVTANRVRLEQVLVNLLQNALEALEGRESQSIDIAVETAGETVRLIVSDDGPGIAAEVMAQLFTPFVTTKPRGVGLGLAISRDIVEEFGGRLEVASEPDRGTRFVITLRGAA
jgi:two-component system, NtrC family, C4-dicarboxylate transport sensor histidine kinase DctB